MAVKTVGIGVVTQRGSRDQVKGGQRVVAGLKLAQASPSEVAPSFLYRNLEASPDPYLILAPDLKIQGVTPAYLKATRQTRDQLVGRCICEVYPAIAGGQGTQYQKSLHASLTYVQESLQPHQMGTHRIELPPAAESPQGVTERFWSPLNAPVLSASGTLVGIIHKLQDVTETVQHQRLIEGLTQERQAIQEALGHAQSVQLKLRDERRRLKQAEAVGHLGSFEVVFPERAVFCSDELFRIYGLEPQSEPVIFEHFAEYIHPEDRQRYKEAVQTFCQDGGTLDLIHRIIRADGEIRIVHTRTANVWDQHGQEVSTHGTMQDITEQKLAQERLEANATFLQQAEAVGHTGSYEANLATQQYKCSDEVYRLLGYPPQSREITFEFIDSITHPEDLPGIRQQLEQAILHRQPYHYTRRIYFPDGHIRQVEVKGKVVFDEDGQPLKLLGTLHDITDQIRTDLILDTISEVCFELDELLQFRYANRMAYQTWGKTPEEVLGKGYLEVFPHYRGAACDGLLRTVLETRKQALQEVYNSTEDKWHFYNVMPGPTGIIVLYFDITDKVKAREEVLLHQEQLQVLVENIPDLISRWRKDTTLEYCNSNFETKFNLEPGTALGKPSRELGLLPEVAEPFTACLQEVFRTGVPKEHAFNLKMKEGRTCLLAHLVPEFSAGGGVESVLAIAYDITQIMQAKGEIKKHLNILRQSEELAGMGSWEYDIDSGTFTWSEGMYHLFGMKPGDTIKADLALSFVVPEDQALAREMMEKIQVTYTPFEESVRMQLPLRGARVLKVKGFVIVNRDRKPTKVLGVNWDITEMERLASENLAIKLSQQKEMLLAILETQEAERARIAEALHNGMAQLLYAVKLNLNQVSQAGKALRGQEIKEGVDRAEKILTMAIQQVRSLSHELMPTPLSDLGLEAAIKDICATLSSRSLPLACYVFNLHTPLEKHLELAVYRIAQELANNIVKHAQATEASLLLREQRGALVLEAEDNGQGFVHAQLTAKGMGLKAIQDRVRLLNGTIDIDSEPGRGTTISIYLPLPTAQAAT